MKSEAMNVHVVEATSVSAETIHAINEEDAAEAEPTATAVVESDQTITVSKTVAGASIAGAVLGTCLLGPIGEIIIGGISISIICVIHIIIFIISYHIISYKKSYSFL